MVAVAARKSRHRDPRFVGSQIRTLSVAVEVSVA